MPEILRNTRSISQQAYSKIQNSHDLQIKIQEPIIRDNISQLSSSIHDPNRSQLSIHDKINMLNQSIRTSQKNQRLFQQNMILRERLHQTEDALQDANIKCSLWDKFKLTIQGLNKDYLQLKSVQNNCSDGTILKQFLTVLKDKLEKVSISQRIEKSYSVESKRKDTEYYQLYEQQKKQRYEYQQHIITLNNELDILEEQNQKYKEKIRNSSLRTSDIMGSDGQILSVSEKQLYQELTGLKQQYKYILQHKKTLQQQLKAERERVKQIVQSWDQYETELKKGQLQLEKKIKDLENQLQLQKQMQKTLKIQLQQEIQENDALRNQTQRLSTLLNKCQTKDSSRKLESVQSQKNNKQNSLQSQQYLQVLKRNEILNEKYNKVRLQNQHLGEEKQKIGQQLQELQQLSKSMEYNYQVKIDDLRIHYEGELQGIIANYNSKIKSLKDEHQQKFIQIDNQKENALHLVQQLQSKIYTNENNQSSQINQYDNNLIQHQQQQIHQKEQIIVSLENQISSLKLQLQNQSYHESKITEKESMYQQKIQNLTDEIDEVKEKEIQFCSQIQILQKRIQSITSERNQQHQMIQCYLEQLSKKDELFTNLSNEYNELKKFMQRKSEEKGQKTTLTEQIQALKKLNDQLRKAFNQNEENNSLLKRNITEWENKYNFLTNDIKNLQFTNQSLKNQHLDYQNLTNQLEVMKQKQSESIIQNNNLAKSINQLQKQNYQLSIQLQVIMKQLVIQRQNTQSSTNERLSNFQFSQTQNQINMDGLMAQSLKEQIQTLLQENRLLQDENNRYHQQIVESQQQVQQIQRYVKMISGENKKIPHYEQQLTHEKLKNQRLKQKLIEQKDKFISIMEKNQSLYEQLVKKSETNETILKENIQIQKEETSKLQNILNKYYTNFISSEKYNQKKQNLET